MACLNVKEASFEMYAFGADAYDYLNAVPSYDDIHSMNDTLVVSPDKVRCFMEKDPIVASVYGAPRYEQSKLVQLWHIPATLLLERYHFSHSYLASYVATWFNDQRQVIIKYGAVPTWLLKRIF